MSATKVINRVLLSAMRYKRPVYLELPRDKVLTSLPLNGREKEGRAGGQQITDINFISKNALPESDIDSLKEAINEAKEMIKFSRKPIIVAGVEIHRFGLQRAILTLIEKTGIPVVSTVLSKSVISENNPLYLGVYEGAMGHEWVRRSVESSDCLVLLGAPVTDIDFSITPTPIDQSKAIYVTSERLSIKHHSFDNVYLNDFLNGLIEVTDYLTSAGRILGASETEKIELKHQPKIKQESNRQGLIRPEHGNDRRKKITVRYLFERLNLSVNNSTVVIADTGDALFGSLDLTIHDQTEFLCPAYYLSMGFAVPAAIGAQLANSSCNRG